MDIQLSQAKHLLYLSFILFTSACINVPERQVLKVSSNSEHHLGMGVVGANFSAPISNLSLTGQQQVNQKNTPERLTNSVFIYSNDEDTIGTCHSTSIGSLNMVKTLRSSDAGSAIVINEQDGESFPNSLTALQQLKEQYGEAGNAIELMVKFGESQLTTTDNSEAIGYPNALVHAGNFSIAGKYQAADETSRITFYLIGVPDQPSPIEVASAPLPPLRVIFNFNDPDTCTGESVLIEPYYNHDDEGIDLEREQDRNLLLQKFKATVGQTNLSFALVGASLQADTRDNWPSFCFIIPGHVAIETTDHEASFKLGSPNPENTPLPRANFSTGYNGCESL
ncbi:hypothetical protein [Shewanella waksmanii]|uniref:hypothetical protein n=1 Tax=Shewanella waksmanii TaxID=213783 RepID=UPI0037352E97